MSWIGSLTYQGWRAIGGQNAAICYPSDGADVMRMVSQPGCTIIVLTRSSQKGYSITAPMNVSSLKILVGNPIDTPALNVSGRVERLFNGKSTRFDGAIF